MTIRLDPPLQIGDIRIAALCQTAVAAGTFGFGIAGHAAKKPIAVLIDAPAGLTILDTEGRAIDRKKLEAMAPKALAEFEDLS